MKGISIVMCSYNGCLRLEPTILHLLAQKHSSELNVEFVFVDNRSDDGTYEFVEKYLASRVHTLSVKLLREQRPGKAYAVERAYDSATYDYIITCDDDNWLCADFAQKAYDLMESLPEVGLIGCKTIGEFEVPPPAWFNTFAAGYAVGSQCKSEGYYDETIDYVWGAGMVFRRSIWVYLRSKGFEFVTGKNINKAVGEDAELSIVVKGLGYRLYYSESLTLHHWMPKDRLTWKKCVSMFRGFGSSSPYIDIYRMLFKTKVNETEVRLYDFKMIINYGYTLALILAKSKFMPWLSLNRSEGSRVKLTYVTRLSSLKELLFNREFQKKKRKIRGFVEQVTQKT